jgi:hypothetical protein
VHASLSDEHKMAGQTRATSKQCAGPHESHAVMDGMSSRAVLFADAIPRPSDAALAKSDQAQSRCPGELLRRAGDYFVKDYHHISNEMPADMVRDGPLQHN